MQRVALKPEDHRGGLLTQASILSLTSDGTRHRPVHRGEWVLESISATPPPPAAAERAAAQADAARTSRRRRCGRSSKPHRSDANCAACHRKIDPLGLAFDNYDAIGHWRTEEAVRDGAGANPKLDPSGELPDGRKFADAEGLKQLMVDDIDKFAAAFVEKLATYALRRGMTFDDRKALAGIADAEQGRRVQAAVVDRDLVLSDLFQKR